MNREREIQIISREGVDARVVKGNRGKERRAKAAAVNRQKARDSEKEERPRKD